MYQQPAPTDENLDRKLIGSGYRDHPTISNCYIRQEADGNWSTIHTDGHYIARGTGSCGFVWEADTSEKTY